MASEQSIRRYRDWYGKLIRLYPGPYRERFGEGMVQVFNDLCRERQEAGEGLFALALWVFVETSTGIVRERMAIVMMHNKRLVGILVAITILLLIPLVAMQFTDEVNWGLGDFLVAGFLLFSTGLTYEFAARRAGNTAYRAAIGVAVVTALLLTWTNLAVGLIGSEDNPVNLMYFGVVAIGIIGAGIARFQPRGMSRTLFATALTQALVPVIALIISLSTVISNEPFWGNWGAVGVFGLNAFFVGLFVVSALLFRDASATGSQ